jgi:hypothetical protein
MAARLAIVLALALAACADQTMQQASSATAAASSSPGAGTCGQPVDIQLKPVLAGVPENVRAFHGRWGENYWDNVLCHVLYVVSVAPDGSADVRYIYGAYRGWNINQPGVFSAPGRISGNMMRMTNPSGTVITYTFRDGKLDGLFAGRNKVTLQKSSS